MKGILRSHPPKPRYMETWDIDILLKYLDNLPDNNDLSLKQITQKLAVLLAVATPKRVSELSRLDRKYMTIANGQVKFQLPGLSKSQKDCTTREVIYPHYPANPKLCVLNCIQLYLSKTQSFRSEEEVADPLLRTTIRPHKRVSANTVSYWVKHMMNQAGIGTSKFKAHSTRGASTSKAACVGVPIHDILQMADWSNASTFHRFYNRSVSANQYVTSILSLGE